MKAHIRTFRSKKLHPEHVKLINEAIRHNAKGKQKDIVISYKKENGEVSERKVRPFAVKDKSLFVAHCHERNAIRSFRVERISMVKQAFWNGFEKQSAARSEILGTTLNPFSAALSPLALALGVAVGPYGSSDQKKVNKKSTSNALIPGVAPYRYGRRLTGNGLSDEERDNQ
jgi:hypothetical protein